MGTIYTFHNEADLDSIADADKFLVYDASTGLTKSATATDLKVWAGAGIVDVTSAAVTITQAAHANRVVTLNRAAGITATLPAATGSGDRYTFFVGTTVTSNNDIIKVADATDIMYGNIIANSTGDTPDLAQPWPTAADTDTITLNGSTTGGIKGDFIALIDVATDTWSVQGVISASGTEATPFSATVS
jgi:hypothetical protein